MHAMATLTIRKPKDGPYYYDTLGKKQYQRLKKKYFLKINISSKQEDTNNIKCLCICFTIYEAKTDRSEEKPENI